jgi:hypothetical protein
VGQLSFWVTWIPEGQTEEEALNSHSAGYLMLDDDGDPEIGPADDGPEPPVPSADMDAFLLEAVRKLRAFEPTLVEDETQRELVGDHLSVIELADDLDHWINLSPGQAWLRPTWDDDSTFDRFWGYLQKARVAAELVRDGDVLRLIPGAPIEIPSAAVEIDIDTEWDRQGRVYLWGLLVTADGDSNYVAFSDPSVLDAEGELAIARQCFDWLAATHPAALVFHYTAPEPSHARRILGKAINAYAGTSAGLEGWHDLHRTVVACMESRSGLGLKVVATEAAGFHWRDEEPGGLESQAWLDLARAGDDSAWRRILAYNEDDVRATLAVRRFLHSNS